MTSPLVTGLPFFLGIVFACAVLSRLAFSLGRRLGVREAARTDHELDGPMGAHVTATLALLAFTLAIVFSQAHGRYSERKKLLREDVVSIRTAYERVDLLGAAAAAAARAELLEYTRLRVEAPRGEVPLDEAIADSVAIQHRLWTQAADHTTSPHVWFYMEALSAMSAVHGERVTMSLHDRIPTAVWLVLGIVSLLAMAITGYQSGLAGSRRSWTMVALVFAYSLLACLAVDLDRSTDGILRVDQGPMERLYEEFTAGSRR